MTAKRRMGPKLGWAAGCLWVATTLLACTTETSGDSEEPDVPSGESNLGKVSQALNEFLERPAVAAVGVGVNGGVGREMWVFACASDHILYRRVKPSSTSNWQTNWTQAAATPCAGVPTAGAGSALPQDDVEVFYRSTTGKLIELYYRPNGTSVETDLSAELGLGTLLGNPVIAKLSTSGAVAVAYRNLLNQLKTVSWTPAGGWSFQPVMDSGAAAFADGTITAMYTPRLTYLAASSGGLRRVFSRNNWEVPYARINTSISAPGVLTFAAPTQTTMLVLNRDGSNRVIKSDVVPGQAWNFTIANGRTVLATPYMGGAWSYDGARSYTNDRGVSTADNASGPFTALWGLDNSQASTYISPGKYIRSGGTRPVNPGSSMDHYAFYADESLRVQWVTLAVPMSASFSDMGINVVSP
jgi:hypothetical protein